MQSSVDQLDCFGEDDGEYVDVNSDRAKSDVDIPESDQLSFGIDARVEEFSVGVKMQVKRSTRRTSGRPI